MGCWRSRVSTPPKSLGYSKPQLTELPRVRGPDMWTLPPLFRVRSELCPVHFQVSVSKVSRWSCFPLFLV